MQATLSSILTVLLSLLLLSTPAWSAETIKVYAAASLTNALNELKVQYEKTHDVSIKTSFAGSATLAKQIEAGAPAHIFASADQQWMNYLQKRRLIQAGSRRELLGNTLVLIAPKNQAVNIKLDAGVVDPTLFKGRICTGDPASVPVGVYAKAALQKLGWWSMLNKNIVATDDVRTALAFVERAECAFGIVYATDAKISNKVTVVARFPAHLHPPMVYPFALLPHASTAAQGFFQYLQSPEAQVIFNQYGFISLAKKP